MHCIGYSVKSVVVPCPVQSYCVVVYVSCLSINVSISSVDDSLSRFYNLSVIVVSYNSLLLLLIVTHNLLSLLT